MPAFKLEATFYNTKQFKKLLGKKIVILGRSNVGKSSFINSVFRNKKLAKTSKKAGKTISINCYQFDKNIYLIDFPGYGYAARSYKIQNDLKQLCESYLLTQSIDLALLLIDSRRGLMKSDMEIINYLSQLKIIYKIILTKIDKLSNNELFKIKKIFTNNKLPYICHSSLKNIGNKKVIQLIKQVKAYKL